MTKQVRLALLSLAFLGVAIADLELPAEPATTFKLPDSVARQVAQLISQRNISVAIRLRATRPSLGTLLIAYGGRRGERQLELVADGRRNRLELLVRHAAGRTSSLTAAADFADGDWHLIVLEIQRAHYRLLFDCVPVLNGADFPSIRFDNRVEIFLGQKRYRRLPFVGSISEFTADAGRLAERRCPTPTNTAPTTTTPTSSSSSNSTTTSEEPSTKEIGPPAPLHVIHDNVEYLRDRVGRLERKFETWHDALEGYKKQLHHVQLHQRGCQLGPLTLADGDRWSVAENCTSCVCHKGKTACHRTGCAEPNCDQPMPPPAGACCPVCGADCFYNNRLYEHGVVFWPEKCVRCRCLNGTDECSYESGRSCPEVDDCPARKQRRPPRQCCKKCYRLDFCKTSPCHELADCENRDFDRLCKCRAGYFGDGQTCYDIDECARNATTRRKLGGCGHGTRCINTPGSYRCECLAGFAKNEDGFSCIDTVPSEIF